MTPTQASNQMLKRRSDRDQETVLAVESLWQKAGYWPMPGVRAEIMPPDVPWSDLPMQMAM